MENLYNVWNKWDPLKTVVLGDTYRPEFYRNIKNKKIRDGLMQITNESLEDLENFENVLKQFGCKVLRPHIDPNDDIMDHLSDDGKVHGSVPRSPLQPRDSQFVAGNKIFYCMTEKPIEDLLDSYNSKDKIDIRFKNPEYNKWNREVTSAACYTLIGRDLYVSLDKFEDWQQQLIKDNIPNVRYNRIFHSGHSDGCFHAVNSGAIISIKDVQTYSSTFPNWDVLYLTEDCKTDLEITGYMKMKRKVRGKWWVPGQEDNDEFTHFVETWLQDWVGFVEETIFDVNCIVVDPHHVIVSSLNPIVTEFLKKHNMEPVHVPWRHRWFWDGGLHCITLDLYREGTQQDYFPERKSQGIIDHIKYY